MGNDWLSRIAFPVTLFAISVAMSGCGSDADKPITGLKHKPAKKFMPARTEEFSTRWTPPESHLPAEFVHDAVFLKTHGLADPSGGRFSKVKLRRWDLITGEPEISEEFGWIVVREGLTGFVNMDGLTYFEFEDARPTDINKYVLNTKLGIQKRPPTDRLSQTLTFKPWEAHPALPIEQKDPQLAAVMMFVDRHPELAEQLLAADKAKASLQALTTDLFRAKWRRALEAYVDGDDEGALNLSKDLAIFARAAQDEIDRPSAAQFRPNPKGEPIRRSYLFPFRQQVPALISEAQRRLVEANRSSKSASGLSKQQRIADLIAGIEDWRAAYNRPMVVPRLAKVGIYDNTRNALMASGTSAVGPLLKCIENDTRLTREVELVQGEYHIVPVHDEALKVFSYLTHAPYVERGDKHATSAEAVKKWWTNEGRLDPMDRAYHVLADDTATPEEWVEAAQAVSGSPATYGSFVPPVRVARTAARLNKSPSVSVLIDRRIDQLLSKNLHSATKHQKPSVTDGTATLSDRDCIEKAVDLCRCLWTWDPSKRSLKPIQATSERLRLLQSQMKSASDRAAEDGNVITLLQFRIELGDKEGLQQYKDNLKRMRNTDTVDASYFVYFYRHRKDKAFRGFARQAFLAPVLSKHSHNTKQESAQFQSRPLAQLVADSPLIEIPEEREAVIELLKDKTKIGSTAAIGKRLVIRDTKGKTIQVFAVPDDVLAPVHGKPMPYRRCDQSMERLSQFKGAPTFRAYWPLDVKDASIQKMIGLILAHQKDPQTLLAIRTNW